MMNLMRMVLLVLLAPLGLGQQTFGPTMAPVGESSPLSVDSSGAADVWWSETGVAAPLPAAPTVTLTMELADGKTWTTSFGTARVLDRGALTHTTLQWSRFHRPGESSLLGAHLFVERRADGVVLLSVKVSNGAIDPANPTSFEGGVFYKRLSLDVGSGTLIADTVRRGESLTGRRFTIANGQHYFPPRAQLNRRLALVPEGRSTVDWRARALAALRLEGLTIPEIYPHFGAAKLQQPVVDRVAMEPLCGARLARLSAALAMGLPDPSVEQYTGPLGPFSPAGYGIAGMVSGVGIEMLPGWEQCRSGALLRRLSHDVEMERMPVALFDAQTGVPLGRLPKPVEYRLTRGWSKSTCLPWTCKLLSGDMYDDRRAPRDWNRGICSYREKLLEFQAHDGQHLVRAIHNGEAAWWLSRDWLARLDLEMVAADARYSWNLYALPAAWGYTPFGLNNELAAAHQGQGSGNVGREFGWTCHAWAVDLAAAGGLSARPEKILHARAALQLAGKVAMPTGITQRLMFGAFWGSPDPWMGNGVPTTQDVAQWVLEGPIVSHGVTGLSRTACAKEDPLAVRASWIVTQWARSAYLNPDVKVHASPWDPLSFGIPKWGIVGAAGGPAFLSVPGAMGDCDPTNSWGHLALAYDLTGDPVYLEATLQLGRQVGTLQERLNMMNGLDLTYTASLLGALQRMTE